MSATARAPLFQTASGRYIEISLEALQIATARHAQEGNTEITEGLAKDLADNCYDIARHEGHLKKRSGRRDDDDDGRHHHHHLADGAGKGVEDSPFGGGFGTESSELVVKADFFFGKSPTKSTASVSSSSPSLSASSHDDGAIAPPPSRPVKTVKKSKKYTDDTFLLAAAAMMNHHKDFNEQDKHWGSPDETFPLEPLQDDGSSEGMALAELYRESSFDDDNDDY